MNKTLLTLLEQLGPLVGDVAIKKLTQELMELSKGKEGWQQASLNLLANAVEKYGPEGIQIALQAIKDLQGNKAPKIDWADLKVASDILAELQNAAADKQNAAHDFLEKISQVLGTILSGIIKGIL